MAIETNAFSTFDAEGIKEDLEDIIYDISPTQTPIVSMCTRVKVTSTLHEWQTDQLDDATTENAHLEGDTYTTAAVTPTTRLSNRTQIMRKTGRVTGTQRAVETAGRADDYDYLRAKRGNELKRDMERVVSGNQGYVEGAVDEANRMRTLESFIVTNADYGVDGESAASGDEAATDGTQRAFDEDTLNDVLQSCWDNGAEPSHILVGGYNKRVFSGFEGRASARANVDDKTILASADLYASDFGDLKVMPTRFQRARTALVVDESKLKLGQLRPMFTDQIAKTGDSDAFAITWEGMLIIPNELYHGKVADLTTASG